MFSQDDNLLLLHFSFASEYTIRKVHESQVGLLLYGAHQLLAYADDVGDNRDTTKKNKKKL
jgi:hypothetical protein